MLTQSQCGIKPCGGKMLLTIFDKDSRKLIFERTLSKNKKGKMCSTFNLSKTILYGIIKIYKVT
jgi:hypothetical protein